MAIGLHYTIRGVYGEDARHGQRDIHRADHHGWCTTLGFCRYSPMAASGIPVRSRCPPPAQFEDGTHGSPSSVMRERTRPRNGLSGSLYLRPRNRSTFTRHESAPPEWLLQAKSVVRYDVGSLEVVVDGMARPSTQSVDRLRVEPLIGQLNHRHPPNRRHSCNKSRWDRCGCRVVAS